MDDKKIKEYTEKLKKLEDEHSQIKGELTAIGRQLEEIGVEGDIEEWLLDTKDELDKLENSLEDNVEKLDKLFKEYEDED